MSFFGRLAVAVLLLAPLLNGCASEGRVIVGAGTTVVDSGLMAQLEATFPGDLSIVAGSTAELLELAAKGAVSAVIVHDPAQEKAFMSQHPTAERTAAFSSRFLIVGPPALVGQIQASSAAAAFAEIAANGWTFVTRDDGSGTFAKEQSLWAEAGLDPGESRPDWYVATGQGMGFSLQVADQRDAFTLAEEGAFLAAANVISLVPLGLASESDLTNPYSAILVDSAARPFYEWMTGADGRRALIAANESVFGSQVYVASDGQ